MFLAEDCQHFHEGEGIDRCHEDVVPVLDCARPPIFAGEGAMHEFYAAGQEGGIARVGLEGEFLVPPDALGGECRGFFDERFNVVVIEFVKRSIAEGGKHSGKDGGDGGFRKLA